MIIGDTTHLMRLAAEGFEIDENTLDTSFGALCRKVMLETVQVQVAAQLSVEGGYDA